MADKNINKNGNLNAPSVVIEDWGEDDTTIVDEDKQGVDNENAGNVTLRRKGASGSGTLPTILEDEYKYVDHIDPSFIPITSRRKIEIGSEKMISDADLRLAATLVSDAMEGRTVDIKTEPKYVRSYNIYKSWPLTGLLYLTISVNLSLVIFEEPGVKNFELQYYVTMPVELICLIYFTIRTCHHAHWRRTKKFLRDFKNIFVIAVLIITLIDMMVYSVMKNGHSEMPPVRYSRVLRAFLIVNFSDGRQIRRAWRNIRRTIKEIAHVIVLFYFFIFVFALIAYVLFLPRKDITYPDGEEYFKDYMECFWDLYVLVTTSNNPDVMMPAYDKSRFYCIFFFVYVMVCFYMLLNVFLAVAYHSYNQNMKEEIKRSSREKKRKLGQAFDVIKINFNGKDMVTYKIWKRLMRLANPNLDKHQVDLLMLILDMNRSGHIGRKEFMNVADLLNVPVSQVSDRTTWLESKFPVIYNSYLSVLLKSFVDCLFFKLMYDTIVVTHVFLLAFLVENIDVAFSALFVIEIFLKIYTYGPKKYFRKIANWFDIVITGVSVLCIVVKYSSIESDTERSTASVVKEMLQVVNILRIFRILRILVHIQRFKIITDTLVNISLSILMYCGIIFMIFYIFAVLGMEIFKNRIRHYGYENVTNVTEMFCGSPELENSDFYESRYCSLNFNDFPNALLVLSTLLFENNWHIVAEGFVLVTNKAARLFFAAFYTSVSVVIMNIVTAFVVDMFMYEYTIQKQGKVDSAVEKKIKELGLGIDAETGLEISAPLTDKQMEDLLKDGGEKPKQHPWIETATMTGLRKAEHRFSRISTFVKNRKSENAPTLTRYDGIRFHIKKSGWTKIEVLLQQLYEGESDIDVTVNYNEDQTGDKNRSLII